MLSTVLAVLVEWVGSVSSVAAVPPPIPPIPAAPGDQFEDVTRRVGIEFVHQFCHDRIANILLSNGAGGAVFDYDQDGYMDLYLVNWGPLEGVTAAPAGTARQPNRLYRNRGDGTFEDRTQAAGVPGTGFGSAAVTGDVDNDGFPDLYVVNAGWNRLYRNRGDGTFADITDAAGVGDGGTGIGAVFLDADHDGWLDLFVANYLRYTPAAESEQNPGAYPGPLAYPGEPNVFYRNRGDGTFEDATQAAGLRVSGHRAMAVAAFDSNGDGHTDLYVANDDTPNALWTNDGRGRFRDVAVEAGVAFNSIGEAPGSMNGTIGDINGDGLPDLFVTRLGYGSLYVRHPKGYYDDRMWASGLGRITQPFVGWGGCFGDVDNDADPDLFIANGDAFTFAGAPALLLENRGDGQFADQSARGGAFFSRKVQGRGAAVLDYDNDGALDVLVTTLANRPFLLRNRGTPGTHWLTLQLEGARSGRSGYGARVSVRAGDRQWQAEALCPTGFLTQGDPRLHFGLGRESRVDEVIIRWPSGTQQTVKSPGIDRCLRVREPDPPAEPAH